MLQKKGLVNQSLERDLGLPLGARIGGLVQLQKSLLCALSRPAQKVGSEAEGLKIVAGLNQKPFDQQAELDAIRRPVVQADNSGETALDRLKRLSGRTTTEVA